MLSEVTKALVDFPAYAVRLLVGLLLAILTDVNTTVLFLATVALGFAVGPLVAVAVGLGVYVTVRITAEGFGALAEQANFHARVIRDNRESIVHLRQEERDAA